MKDKMSIKENETLDDILFKNKNKEYGAYALRQIKSQALLRAFIIGSIFSLLIVAIIFFYNTQVIGGKKNVDTVVDVELTDLNLPEIPEDVPEEVVVEPEPEPVFQEETAQIKAIMPEPKKEVTKPQETIPEQDDMKKKELSDTNREGKDSDKQGGGKEHNPEGDKKPEPIKPKGPETVTARTATVMAIYPGCEKEAAKGKQQAIDCMSQRMSSDLVDELYDFQSIAERQGIKEARTRLSFVIDTKGRIINVSPATGGDKYLSKEAKEALERISSKLERRGKPIIPAKTDNGAAANLQFQIPVAFKLE